MNGSKTMILSSEMNFSSLVDLQVENTGHSLKVKGAFDNITLTGETYNAIEFHLHSPSEHAIDGELAKGEMHIVHRKKGSKDYDDLLVIGIMIEEGTENALLNQIGLPTGPFPFKVETAINLSIALGDQLEGTFYHYDGSLTTPPCSETVKWFVLEMPMTASKSQLYDYNLLFDMPYSARPVQLLGGRKVVKNSLLGCPMEMGTQNQLLSLMEMGTQREQDPPWNFVLPQCWGTVYPHCAGNQQSPIDIDQSSVSHWNGTTEQLFGFTSYTNAMGLQVQNTGHGLQVDVTNVSLGNISIGSSIYNVIQFHFHVPSEHTFNGLPKAGELHIVHQLENSTDNDDLLVIGVFLKEDRLNNNSFFSQLGLPSGAPEKKSDNNFTIATDVNLETTFKNQLQGPFYHYKGSLTTPPCSETVKWFVLETPFPIGLDQLKAFSAFEGAADNARATQLRHGRPLVKGRTSVAGVAWSTAGKCPSRSFSSDAVAWDYSTPQCWSVAYSACAGRAQSPIDIQTAEERLKATGNVDLFSEANYTEAFGKSVMNTGHGLQVDANSSNKDLGSILVENNTYNVVQFHLHCPSEHTIDGRLKACEMHIVHQKVNATDYDALLVVGITYEAGDYADNAFLLKLGLPYGAPANRDNPVNIPGGVNLATEFANNQSLQAFYRYDGSLTTPPCTESVSWFVLAESLQMSQAQLAAMKTLIGAEWNNRPVQLLNGRAVFKNTGPGCELESGQSWDYVLPVCWSQYYPNCSGQRQSPINIDKQAALESVSSKTLTFEYPDSGSDLALKLKSFGLQVNYSGGGLEYGGVAYKTEEFHLHVSSEHTIDGKYFSLEMHVVHKKNTSTGDGDLLVVGVMYKIGSESAFLNRLGLPANTSILPYNIRNSSELDLDDELNFAKADGFYQYDGSLTTPPCSETVTWIVLATPRTMSKEQLATMKTLVPEPANNRPLQPLYGRCPGKNGGTCHSPQASGLLRLLLLLFAVV
jgi:carbonic anhydrase